MSWRVQKQLCHRESIVPNPLILEEELQRLAQEQWLVQTVHLMARLVQLRVIQRLVRTVNLGRLALQPHQEQYLEPFELKPEQPYQSCLSNRALPARESMRSGD
jgi:hypothetical protein